jgi:transcription antitermination factor NusG
MGVPDLDKHWFALYTKPKHEFKAETGIGSFGIETYLPAVTVKKKWSDRVKSVREPLLRGYIFIYADEKERLASLTAAGIVSTVCFEGHPARIPEWQIDGLKKMLQHDGEILVSDRIPAGTKVKVITWPFEGMIGIVEENQNNEKYLSIAIEILNRTVSVRLPSDAVVKTIEHQEIK